MAGKPHKICCTSLAASPGGDPACKGSQRVIGWEQAEKLNLQTNGCRGGADRTLQTSVGLTGKKAKLPGKTLLGTYTTADDSKGLTLLSFYRILEGTNSFHLEMS